MPTRPPAHIVVPAFTRALLSLALASCSHSAAPQQPATPPPPPPPPLTEFTVTYGTEEFGAVPGSHIVLTVASDGTAHMNVGMAGRPLRQTPTVHLPPSRLTTLARVLAEPAFAHLTSTRPGGEGRTTSISVHAPRLNLDYEFYEEVPPQAGPVVNELASLSNAVSALAIADQSANGVCASDADCMSMNCECRCYAFPNTSIVRGGCSPGHCAAEPCRGHPVCDPATHRCGMSP